MAHTRAAPFGASTRRHGTAAVRTTNDGAPATVNDLCHVARLPSASSLRRLPGEPAPELIPGPRCRTRPGRSSIEQNWNSASSSSLRGVPGRGLPKRQSAAGFVRSAPVPSLDISRVRSAVAQLRSFCDATQPELFLKKSPPAPIRTSVLPRACNGPWKGCLPRFSATRNWYVASDERKVFRQEALARFGQGGILTTAGVIAPAIRANLLTDEPADQIRLTLETKRFRMTCGSFRDIVTWLQTQL